MNQDPKHEVYLSVKAITPGSAQLRMPRGSPHLWLASLRGALKVPGNRTECGVDDHDDDDDDDDDVVVAVGCCCRHRSWWRFDPWPSLNIHLFSF